MGKQFVSERHKPSFGSYLRHNLKTTFAVAEKAELMTALGWILVSAVLGLIGGLSAPAINNVLTPWQLRVAFGFIVFIVIQFGIFTPFRMWQKATWVADIERLLEDLWDSHDKGVELLNSHVSFIYNNPDATPGSKKAGDWVEGWV